MGPACIVWGKEEKIKSPDDMGGSPRGTTMKHSARQEGKETVRDTIYLHPRPESSSCLLGGRPWLGLSGTWRVYPQDFI